MNITFVTGNPNKAKQVEELLSIPVTNAALDIPEIQSLDLEAIVEAKARAAYAHLGTPVIVDDVSMELDEMKGLPGPLVKWFLESMGPEGICRLADITKTRAATATVAIGYCDDKGFKSFKGSTRGTIAPKPSGTTGFGWDATFIQDGYTVTRAELGEEDYVKASIRKVALDQLKAFLTTSA